AWNQSPSTPATENDPLAETIPFNGHHAVNGSHDEPAINGARRGGTEFLNNVASLSAEELAEEIQAWMLGWLEERAEPGVGELSPTAPFTELGMDSLTALELNVEFEKVLGVRLPPAAAWSYPTPAELSRFLADSMQGVAAI